MGIKKNRPSLKDIANHVGVSITAVSAVINNKQNSSVRLSQETRQRIMQSIKELGYAPNTAAQVLAGGRSKIIAVFTYESIFPFEYHSFFYPFLLGMEREAERQKYDLLFMTSCSNQEGGRSIYQNGVNRLRLADTAVLLGLQKNTEEISRLLREHFPVVIIGHREIPGHEPSYVAADYTTSTAEIVKKVAQRGHKNIALLRVVQENEPSTDREIGFNKGCDVAGIKKKNRTVIKISVDKIDEDFLDKLIEKGITATICERYFFAYAINTILTKTNRKIPDDLSVAVLGGPHDEKGKEKITLSDSPEEPDWMTLHVPSQEMGIESVNLALRLLEYPHLAPLRTTLSCPIIDGDTVATIIS